MNGSGIIPDLTHGMYQPDKRASRIALPKGIGTPKPQRKSEHWRKRRFEYLRANGRVEDLIKEFGKA